MKKLILLLFLISFSIGVKSQSYTQLTAPDAVTGKTMELSSMVKGKGLVLIFHTLECPFVKMYEDRIKALRGNFQNQGFTFALVNPEAGNSESDFLPLRNHINESGLNMSYLSDYSKEWAKAFGITKIPEVIVLIPSAEGPKIAYRGAIDNNPQAESAVTERHLERALNQIAKGESPAASQVRPVGCNLRTY